MNEHFLPDNHEGASKSLSPAFLAAIRSRLQHAPKPDDLTEKIAGRSEIYCRLDEDNQQVVEVASVATEHRGYEALLPGRELGQVGRVSALASGLCGGVHATASALCLEMALGISPPPLGIVLRNLLLSCQYFNDNVMHLFVLAGPDYSREIVENTSPLLWDRARQSHAQGYQLHGFRTVGDIMEGLSKGHGVLYQEALKMAAFARRAYSLLGGKYPHSESIVPGGVNLSVDASVLRAFAQAVEPFACYSQKAAAIWNDVFDFFLSEEPAYANLGLSKASLMDFGQWDHPEHYDASYLNCDDWGAKRWSSPGIVVNGQLKSSSLSELNAGLEEGVRHSFQEVDSASADQMLDKDPKGHALGTAHPWNQCMGKPQTSGKAAYSWGSSLTWNKQNFEVGAYARLYITAKAKLGSERYFTAQGDGLEFDLPTMRRATTFRWRVPALWNAFERNRARAHVLAFNMAVTLENLELAQVLVRSGQTQCQNTMSAQIPSGRRLGVGLWGASRGFLAHWAVIEDGRISSYRISIPSRVNIGTRTDAGILGPLEAALTGSPLIAVGGAEGQSSYIDIQRAIQSFDPCMSCSAFILSGGENADKGGFIKCEIDTAFPA